jgi:hypothetical protein
MMSEMVSDVSDDRRTPSGHHRSYFSFKKADHLFFDSDTISDTIQPSSRTSSKSYSTESKTLISTPYTLRDFNTPPLALLGDRALAPPSLRSDEPTGAPPLKPRGKCPFWGLRLRRDRESTPTAREEQFFAFVHLYAPFAPYASLRDVPPRSSLRSSEGGLASERGSLPLTDARIMSAFHAGVENKNPDLISSFSSGFVRRRPPGGPSRGGTYREPEASFSRVSGYGAEPCRLARAKRRGRRSPIFRSSVACKTDDEDD